MRSNICESIRTNTKLNDAKKDGFFFVSLDIGFKKEVQILKSQKRICISLLCMYYYCLLYKYNIIWRVRSRASTTKQVEPNRKTAERE